jgi:Tfp pilus assembly protein PilF
MLRLACVGGALLFLAGAAFAQTGGLEGDVRGPDGSPAKDAVITIDRMDIRGHYETKTDKKGHWVHMGLPLGMFTVSCYLHAEDKEPADLKTGVRAMMGDRPTIVNFDLEAKKAERERLNEANQSGKLTKEQDRAMTPQQKAEFEKKVAERDSTLKKNKALNDAYTQGVQAIEAKQWDTAVQALEKGTQMDDKQPAIWAHLADAYLGSAESKAGPDREASLNKALEAYQKAIALKPEDGSMHNNYALALARAKKIPEMQVELTKAAELDPPNAGKYYYNLGAVLVNSGQNEAAGEAFKKAIDLDPNYADAHYQYGIYLISKAKVLPDGKIDSLPGTREAFQKYLELKPNGPYAEPSKQMIASLGGAVQTEYKDPNAPAKSKKK